MHYTYTHCGGPPSVPWVHDETGEFSTRYCIQHAHCTSSVFTRVQVCLAVQVKKKKKCLHLSFVHLLHSVDFSRFNFEKPRRSSPRISSSSTPRFWQLLRLICLM
ncbi:unnamed protein product [Ixodes hexagonus]